MPDTSNTLDISQSPIKVLRLVIAGALMTGAAGTYAFHIIPNPPGSFREFIGYIGLVFFGLCTVAACWRLIITRGKPVITLSPKGIRDTRLASEFIPWSSIRNISTWEMHRQKVMVLAVDPTVEDKLSLTRIARWSRGANRKLGADGLCVTAQALNIDYNTLLATTRAYAKAALPSD